MPGKSCFHLLWLSLPLATLWLLPSVTYVSLQVSLPNLANTPFQARMIQEIARQGFLPFSDFVSSTKPFNAPMGALIVHFIPSFLVITIPSGHIYSLILDIEGFPAQFFAIAIASGLIWLRFKRPDLHRPYKAWLSVVCVRIALSAALIVAPFVPRRGLNWRQHLSQVSYAFVGTTV